MRICILYGVLLFAFSCTKSTLEQDLINSPEEVDLIQYCRDNPWTDVDRIAENLQGTWDQVGYGCGFCSPHQAPKSSIIFESDRGVLTIESDNVTEKIPFSWTIEMTRNIFQESTLRLITKPSHYALQVDIFCEELMAFDHTPVDGHMFIFEKSK